MSKKSIIAVAVTPDMGLEVAEMNYATGTIDKYVQKDIGVVTVRNIIPDLDVFKEVLADCFAELGIAKGSGVILSLPTINMGIGNYMTSQSDESIVQLISGDLIEKELLFRDNDPLVVTTGLSVTVQSKIVAYTASVYSIVQEAARIIVEMGYKIESIDVSTASVFRALIQTGKVQAQPDTTWMMLLADNSAARLLVLDGERLVEYKEEQLMYDFSDTAGNCDMVAQAISPYFEKVPAKYLFVVSRTDCVSAEMLASKLKYNNAIIFLEANSFKKEGFIDAPQLPADVAMNISLDVIGACLYNERYIHFNLFSPELGDVYWAQQPPQFKFGETTVVLSNDELVKWVVMFLLIILLPAAGIYYYFMTECGKLEEDYNVAKQKLVETQAKIKKYEGMVSAEKFSESDEIRIGVSKNTEIYNYFDLLGREMPKKLWLTSLTLSNSHVELSGQADNIESIYTFFRNIKDAISGTPVKLQKLGLANAEGLTAPVLSDEELPENNDMYSFDENSNDIILSSNADFYEFLISDKTAEQIARMKSPKADKKAKGKTRKKASVIEIEE